MEEPSKASAGADLSSMSDLIAARKSLISEDCREKSGPSLHEVPKLMGRFPGSFKEGTLIKRDQKIQIQGVMGPHHNDNKRTDSNDPVLVSICTYFDPSLTCNICSSLLILVSFFLYFYLLIEL